MSWWKKLAGIGIGVAGALTGQPELIATGAGIVGSDIKAESAKKAGQQQQAAGERAIGFQAPYSNLGTSATQNLQGLIGHPVMPAVTAGSGGGGATSYTANPAAAFQSAGSSTLGGAAGTLASMFGGGGTPQMVTVQAPTGETKAVPASEQMYWLGKGAKVVS